MFVYLFVYVCYFQPARHLDVVRRLCEARAALDRYIDIISIVVIVVVVVEVEVEVEVGVGVEVVVE